MKPTAPPPAVAPPKGPAGLPGRVEITGGVPPAGGAGFAPGGRKGRAPLKAAGPSRERRSADAAKPGAGTRRYTLRLFVAGATEHSREAILRVQQLCAAEPAGDCELEVLDIYQQPELARKNQIVATPTLVREFPRPARRFIGSLSNVTGLFGEFGLVIKGGLAP